MKLTLEEFFKLLSQYEIEEIEGLRLEGDIEIELEEGSFAGVLAEVANEINLAIQHLNNALAKLGISPALQPQVERLEGKALLERKFEPFRVSYSTAIQEVQLGAKRSEGGSRESVVKLGGEKSLPFYLFDSPQPNLPVISIDVFDKPIPLPKAVREHYGDVMEDPAEWAKKAVKFGADVVTIHLVSTDPLLDDTPPSEAAKVVEEVLQAVKVPIIVGGSGNKEKDPVVLEKAAEAAEGERILLASATLDTDWERIGNAAKKHNQVVLSWTQMDINNQKTLNRYLLKRLKLPKDSLVMDPTTAALGYGLDYAYTNMERIRLAGLKGDEDLAFPISSGTTNAWGAREAWMKDSPIEGDTPWGPRELRG
ncbi:MAG TPA: CO dehydrogenase/acetyl-CoA synthase subunit delta, partial [Archaeoglobus veneficus]|nr:CO dehydrogenase/acetyl-CoA synthase subunit delta [Archaeoglobus veneficus]